MEALGERIFRDIVGILPQPGHLRDKVQKSGTVPGIPGRLATMQQESLTNLEMCVHTGEKDITPLQSGVELSEWEKKEKVREMEEMNSFKERDMQKLREISMTDLEEKKEIKESIVSALYSKSSLKEVSGLRACCE